MKGQVRMYPDSIAHVQVKTQSGYISFNFMASDALEVAISSEKGTLKSMFPLSMLDPAVSYVEMEIESNMFTVGGVTQKIETPKFFEKLKKEVER